MFTVFFIVSLLCLPFTCANPNGSEIQETIALLDATRGFSEGGDRQYRVKRLLTKLILPSSGHEISRLFPEGSMAYEQCRTEDDFNPENRMAFQFDSLEYQSDRSPRFVYTTETSYSMWKKNPLQNSHMHNFQLSLWALMERPSYEFVSRFSIDGNDIKYTRPRRVDVRVNRLVPEDFDHSDRIIFAIHCLGEDTMITGVFDIRSVFHSMMDSMYRAENGILGPYVMVATGHAILKSVAFWTNAKTSMGAMYLYYKNMRNQIRFSYSADAVNDKLNELGSDFNKHRNDEAGKWDKLRKLWFVMHHEIDATLTRSFDIYFGQLGSKTFDNLGLLFGQSVYDPHKTRIWRVLAFFGRSMMKIGTKNILALADNDTHSPWMSLLTTNNWLLPNHRWMKIWDEVDGPFLEKTYGSTVYPDYFE